MPWALENEAPGMASRFFQLRTQRFSVGRAPENDLVLPHASLSRAHARFDVSESEAWVEDLGSKNGTSVSGVPIRTRTPVHAGDRVRFGEVETVLRRIAARSAPEDLASMTRLISSCRLCSGLRSPRLKSPPVPP